MEYQASPEEINTSILLTGLTTSVLNTIANLKTENKMLYDELKKSNDKVKLLELENQQFINDAADRIK